MKISEVRKFLDELPEEVKEADPDLTVYDGNDNQEYPISKMECVARQDPSPGQSWLWVSAFIGPEPEPSAIG